MTELILTRKAAASLYSATGSIIVGAEVVRRCRGSIPSALTVVVLHTSGVVACVGEKTPARDETVPFIGLPYGLAGFIASRKHTKSIAEFLKYAEAQQPALMPQVLWVSPANPFLRLKVSGFLAQLFADRSDKAQNILSEKQRQLVQLRSRNEALWQSFETARRMIAGIGFSARNICFDLPAGTQNVGVVKGDTTANYSQILPIDVSGFTGISLHVSGLDNTPGELLLIIRRRSNETVIGSTRQPYSCFSKGWHHFSLAEVTGRAFGDAVLQLHWTGAGGPSFSIADAQSEGFGNGSGHSLAMRIERGLVEPEIDGLQEIWGTDRVQTHLRPITLFRNGDFLGGVKLQHQREVEQGCRIVSVDPDDRWLQIHALKNNVAALRIPGVLGKGTKMVQAEITVAHLYASPCVAILVAGTAESMTIEVVDALFAGNVVGGFQESGKSGGLWWSTRLVKSGCTDTLALQFEQPLEHSKDLLLAVIPLVAGKNDRGWVRWHNVGVSQEVPELETPLKISAEQKLTAESRQAQIRVHRFSEIIGRLTYYRGAEVQALIKKEQGFWPIEFNDDIGAIPMQLNPLKKGVCAAVLEMNLAENIRRIACDVGTEHQLAKPFVYIMGIFPVSENRIETIDAIAGAVESGAMSGVLPNGAFWTAVTVPTLTKTTVELMVSEPCRFESRLFFAVLPIEAGENAFGWCRWHLLSLETAGSHDATTLLLTKSNHLAGGEAVQ